MGQADAFEKLKNGEIAATDPDRRQARGLDGEAQGAGRLPHPAGGVSPSRCRPNICRRRSSTEDYPGLIAPGQKVETIAVGAVLIAFNWPKGTDRYRRIQKFVDNFFPRLAEFQKAPRHPKWNEANLAAVLPGWKRFEGADEWLRKRDAHRARASASSSTSSWPARREKAASLPSEERDRLFQEFLQWKARERALTDASHASSRGQVASRAVTRRREE